MTCVACRARPQSPDGPTAVDAMAPIDVAITVDDLPRNGPDVAGITRLSIHERLLAAFARHRTPPVYGFVNGAALDAHPEERAALVTWHNAGFPLANHTYSHADAAKLPEREFLADVGRNEALLGQLVGVDGSALRSWKVFRFPYLREGPDVASRASLRAELTGRGYRIAEVTVDFFDWAYAEAYARCAERGDAHAVDVLKESYLDQAAAALLWSDAAARMLFGRPIKQILLLHANAITALLVDDLLSSYERRGARFVSLDDALSDPVYADEPRSPEQPFGNFLTQVRAARGARSPVFPPPPDTLLDLACRR